MHSFEVRSNESPCRKKVHIGLEQVNGTYARCIVTGNALKDDFWKIVKVTVLGSVPLYYIYYVSWFIGFYDLPFGVYALNRISANKEFLVLGCWYHVWDLLGDLAAQVHSCSLNCSRVDFMVVSCL